MAEEASVDVCACISLPADQVDQLQTKLRLPRSVFVLRVCAEEATGESGDGMGCRVSK